MLYGSLFIYYIITGVLYCQCDSVVLWREKNKAADGNRTRDLRITNATLYRLSHSSIFGCFTTETYDNIGK